MKSRKIKEKIQGYSIKSLRLVLLGGISFTILFPLLAKVPSSLMTTSDLLDPTVRWVPRVFTMENFQLAFDLIEYPRSFLLTVSSSLLVSLLQVLSCTLAGYGLARFEFRGKNLLFSLVILTLLVPPQTIMVPQFLNFRFFNLLGILPEQGINLIGTFWPFVFMAITGVGLRGGLFIFIMRQSFKGMSRSLQEAAYLDGAGPWRTFISVMLPNAGPSVVIVFLFAFVWQWNDYYLTSMLLQGTDLLAVRLDSLQEAMYGLVPFEQESLITNASIFMFIAPLLVLYGFMQRYFIESVERTNVVAK
ncbi:MAG: carbohydrate ABC transporter permease [Halanaerobiaceae bacterium]